MAPTSFTGPISVKNKKDDLIAVALALDLDVSGTKEVLVQRISAHLQSHPELAENPQFQGLYIGRANNPKGGAAKNSAEKAKEDGKQASTHGTITGAHHALLGLKYTTDPRPQFTPLHSGAHSGKEVGTYRNDNPANEGGDDDLEDNRSSSPFPSSPAVQMPSDSEMDLNFGTKDKETELKDSLIMVVFQNDSNPQEPPREAHVTGVPILVKNEDGGPTYSARLTDIFPEVFGQGDSMSPIKKQNTRIYRQGVADPHGRSSLGLVDEIVDPARCPKALRLDALNRYSLEKMGDVFACRLFYKEGTEDSPTPPSKEPIKDEAPLDVARRLAAARKEGRVAAMDSATQPVDGFHAFLRAQFGIEMKDVLLERATEMRVVLARHRLLTGSIEKAKAWKRLAGSGGFRVPNIPEYGEFAGKNFTKATIKAALSLTGTKSGDDEVLLSDESLSVSSKALDWARNLESKYCEKFDKMSPAQFKKYLRRKRGTTSNPIVVTSGDDGESVGEKEKKDKKKRRRSGGKDSGSKPQKKGRKEYQSDNMDYSSSSSSA